MDYAAHLGLWAQLYRRDVRGANDPALLREGMQSMKRGMRGFVRFGIVIAVPLSLIGVGLIAYAVMDPSAKSMTYRGPSFAEAKEATRRAVFLNTAQKMTTDAAYRHNLEELFRVCRHEAIAAGAAEGLSEAQVDASISELWEADARRLRGASDEEFRQFARESGEVVNRFLSTLPDERFLSVELIARSALSQ
jgi:hypothetical protein